MTAGLVAYFLGTDSHRAEITAIYNNLPVDQQDGINWSLVVKQYVKDLSYIRTSSNPAVPNQANVIYNGEIPLNQQQQPVCQANPNPKRQDSPDSCESPASASALSLASVVSVSSASVASASSASLASILSASIASVSSVSAVSVSSSEARFSRTLTAGLPGRKQRISLFYVLDFPLLLVERRTGSRLTPSYSSEDTGY
jgi:hypothetical protein